MKPETRDVHRQAGGEPPKIAGYEIKKRLGKGGMAEVHLAFQENLDREVAIKILDPIFLKDEKLLKRFIYEAKTAAKLIHNNIVTIHDVGRSGDNHYIVMELLKESLRDRLKRIGKLSEAKALVIIKKIANALFYAHNKNIIHRDIKPDNIMFRLDETPVLVDFGIARALDVSTHLTMTGVRIGTPYYMSPEQCKGEKLDGRSDIYSLGVVFFELLTGAVPYKSETPTGVIYQHLQAPLPKLSGKLKKHQPLIDKMMAKEKEKRIKNGKELIKIIESLESDGISIESDDSSVLKESIIRREYQKDSSTYRLPETFIQRLIKQKRILAGALAMVIVVLLGLMVYLIMKTSSIDKPLTNSQPGKDPPGIQELTQKPTELPTSQTEKEKIEDIENRGKVKTTPESSKITPRKKKVNIKAQEQKKKNDEVKTKIDDIPKPQQIESKVKTVDLVKLSREMVAKIDQALPGIEISNLPKGIKVYGKIELYLSVNEKGNIHIDRFDDTGIKVIPGDKKELVKNMISTKINGISIFPPKDETGESIKIRDWWKTFKVGTFMGKIILYK
ncbi:MAG: protein kinase [Candidatus Aminicenantes bacterium]|nr:MAG: protein kinase [Candidatus Aminicenantes bacterium]